MQLKGLLISTLLFISASAAAQTRVAADVEEKTVMDGKAVTRTSELYCTSAGNLVQVFSGDPSYYVLTNLSGEFKAYFPKSNEVYSDRRDDFSTKDNIFYLFMSGHSDDLGLSMYGYRLASSTTDEDGLLKRTYLPTSKAPKGTAKIELVLEDYLPIYVGYYDKAGRLVSKSYISSYRQFPSVTLPQRITSISYTSAKDSTIVRTLYSHIRIDGSEPMFDFRIPEGATPKKLFDR